MGRRERLLARASRLGPVVRPATLQREHTVSVNEPKRAGSLCRLNLTQQAIGEPAPDLRDRNPQLTRRRRRGEDLQPTRVVSVIVHHAGIIGHIEGVVNSLTDFFSVILPISNIAGKWSLYDGRMDLGRRIAKARYEAGYRSAEAFAAAIRKSPSVVRKYEAGDVTPPIAVLRAIAEATGRPLEWFVGEGGGNGDTELATLLRRSAEQIEAARREQQSREESEGQPIRAWVRLPIVLVSSAGAWEEAVAVASEYQVVPTDELPPGVSPDQCIAVRVNGDSMAGAGIMPGAIAIVCRNLPIETGNIVLARWGNGVTIKRYVRGVEGEALLPDSTTGHQPVPVGDGVEIIGRVVLSVQRHY